jgi:hypothetical protein
VAQVPYIHCPQCRLTVYGGIAYHDSKRCPRCDTEMSGSPRPLFRSFTLDGGRPKAPTAEAGRQLAGGSG